MPLPARWPGDKWQATPRVAVMVAVRGVVCVWQGACGRGRQLSLVYSFCTKLGMPIMFTCQWPLKKLLSRTGAKNSSVVSSVCGAGTVEYTLLSLPLKVAKRH